MKQAINISSSLSSAPSNLGTRTGGAILFGLTSRHLVTLVIAHVLLAIIARQIPMAATLHAYGTLIVAMIIALSRAPLHQVAYAVAYIAGAEVFWRMTGAHVFWEFGKYVVILIMGLGMFRTRNAKVPITALVYFALLLPSALLTIDQVRLDRARELISFNLSGSLAILVAAAFFHNMTLNPKQIKAMLLILVLPIVSIASVALIGILTNPNLVWVNDSNFASSGGFGPNQVSSALGLGVLALWIILLIARTSNLWLITGLSIWLLVQSMLTFSRGGLVNMLIAMLGIVSYVAFRDPKRFNAVLKGLVGLLIVASLAFPVIDAFTDGMLSVRFSDTGTTNRIEIAAANLELATSSPVWGVGVGMASTGIEDMLGFRAAAHTEFSRLIGEHGLLGGLALVLLVLATMRNFLRASGYSAAGVVVIAVLLWSFAFMLNAAMRIVAPSLLIGLTFAQLIRTEEDLVSE